MKRAIPFLVLLAFAAVAAGASGVRDPLLPRGAVRLGVREGDFRADFDVLPVSAARGMFRRIYLRVTDNDLTVERIVVQYATGVDEEVEVRHEFREGSRSRIIDLAGTRRAMRSIRVVYRTTGALREGKATVTIYGIR